MLCEFKTRDGWVKSMEMPDNDWPLPHTYCFPFLTPLRLDRKPSPNNPPEVTQREFYLQDHWHDRSGKIVKAFYAEY